jgi:hypothetical protein
MSARDFEPGTKRLIARGGPSMSTKLLEIDGVFAYDPCGLIVTWETTFGTCWKDAAQGPEDVSLVLFAPNQGN